MHGSKIITISILFILIMGLFPIFNFNILPVFATVTKVQSKNGITLHGANTMSITLDSAPTNGNTEFCVVGGFGATTQSISSISQTGVTWTQQLQKQGSSAYKVEEIWKGVVGAGASASITITYAVNIYYHRGLATVVEYSGSSTYTLDKTATYEHVSAEPTLTGTTVTTTQADEIWIGGAYGLSSNTCAYLSVNGSATLESGWSSGSTTYWAGLAFGRYVVTSTQTAAMSFHDESGVNSVGLIATFKLVVNSPPSYSNIGTNETKAGYPCKFYSYWTDNTGLSGYIFSTNNTGSWVNDTWVTMGDALTAWTNVSKTLALPALIPIGYRWYCNDTGGVWVDTGLNQMILTGSYPQYPTIGVTTSTLNITQVQSAQKLGAAGTDAYNITFSTTPTSGNTILMAIGGYAQSNKQNVASITQTNVIWSRLVKKQGTSNNFDVEIWLGIVSGIGGTYATITLSYNEYVVYLIADAYEYPCKLLAVDVTSGNESILQDVLDLGITSTTISSPELWVGAAYADSSSSGNMISVNNGFTLYDGISHFVDASNNVALGYISKLYNATNTCTAAITDIVQVSYVGCMATVKLAIIIPAHTTVTFYSNWTDTYGLSYATLTTNNTGSDVNETYSAFGGGTSGVYNVTKLLLPATESMLTFEFLTNSTTGLWNTTGIMYGYLSGTWKDIESWYGNIYGKSFSTIESWFGVDETKRWHSGIDYSQTTDLMYQVSQGSDDAYGVHGGYATDSPLPPTNPVTSFGILDNGAYIGSTTSDTFGLNLRWQNVIIPKNAIVVDAYLEIRARRQDFNIGDGSAKVGIRYQTNNNPSTFSTMVDWNARTFSSSYVVYDIEGINDAIYDYHNVTVTSLIQELVNLGTWDSGDSIVLTMNCYDINGVAYIDVYPLFDYNPAGGWGVKLYISIQGKQITDDTENWFGILIGKTPNEIESWYGILGVKSFFDVEIWRGILSGKDWFNIENWNGLLHTIGWTWIERWFDSSYGIATYGVTIGYLGLGLSSVSFPLMILGLIVFLKNRHDDKRKKEGTIIAICGTVVFAVGFMMLLILGVMQFLTVI